MNPIRLMYVVTHPITACNLMKGQLAFLKKNGFDLLVVSSPGKELKLVAEREKVDVLPVPMHREIRLFSDLISLFRIYRSIVKFKPQIINASTPKAGLLGMVAAFVARVPVRIYVLRGLRLETTRGLTRWILFATERVTSLCAHQIICVSESLRKMYVDLGIAPSAKTVVLASGSSNGIDSSRFCVEFERDQLKQKLGIPPLAPVLGFVGRLVNDKGINHLLHAFEMLLVSFPTLRLTLVGGMDHTDPISSEVKKKIASQPNIVVIGAVEDAASYYRLFDVLVFPSFREGFPNVPMEAAAAGVPTVGFRTTGTVDAVLDGITGTLVPPGDARALADAIKVYLENEQIRIAHGKAAKERVSRLFQPEIVWNAIQDHYKKLLLKTSEPEKMQI